MKSQRMILGLHGIFLFLIAVSPAFAATSWDVTLTDSDITQGEPTGTLTFLVTNNPGSSKDIDGKITFEIDTSLYNFTSIATAPEGWSIDSVAADGSTITFAATGTGIVAGASESFTIIVTGPSSGNILSGGGDVTDNTALLSVAAPGFSTINGGFSWIRHGLYLDLNAYPSSLGPGQTITVSARVTNRSGSLLNNVLVTEPSPSGTGTVSAGSTGDQTIASIAPGATETVTWTFTTVTEGDVTFSTSASGGGGSTIQASTGVLISGGFTAELEIDKDPIVSGEAVTVTMTLTNNGSTALGDIYPDATLTNIGSTSATLASGPSPSYIPSLAAGASIDIIYSYTVTGSLGQTYQFTGAATANGTYTSNTATTSQGSMSEFSAAISPSVVPTGATNQTVSWDVNNNSGSETDTVSFSIPTDWIVSGGDGGTWNVTAGGGTVTFTANHPSARMAAGTTKTFSITFSSVPSVGTDTSYNFRTTISGQSITGEVNTVATVSSYTISISASPSSGISADGSSTSTITATISPDPGDGTNVVFSTSLGTLSSTNAQTSGGVATVVLTAPVLDADATGTVTATFLTSEASTNVSFLGVTGPNIQYIGGSLSPTAPVQNNSYAFQVKVKNLGGTVFSLDNSSTFTFEDGIAIHNFSASLASATDWTVDANGGEATLTFTSTTLDEFFLEGNYNPTINLVDSADSAYDQSRTVSDTINIAAPTYVQLVYLRAEGRDGEVEISWQTSLEIMNLGFHIHRRVAGSGTAFTQITDTMIEGQYDSAMVADYSFTDSEVQNGTVYEYLLEDWEVSNRNTFHGPVRAFPDPDNPWGETYRGGDINGDVKEDLTDVITSKTASRIFTLKDNDSGGIDVSVTVPEPVTETVTLNGNEYVSVSIPGGSLWDREGEPRIPFIATAVEIPLGASAELEILTSDSAVTAGLPVVPVAEREYSTSSNSAFVLNGEVREGTVYTVDGLFPAVEAEIEDLGILRDKHLIALRVFPVRTNPVTGELASAAHISLRVNVSKTKSLLTLKSSKTIAKPGYSDLPPVSDAIGNALKIEIKETGLYSIPYSALAPFGWFPGDPRNLSLYDNGVAVPIIVNGEDDGVFDSSDSIVFYGVSRETPYSDTNIYWLMEGTSAGPRMQDLDGTPSGTDLTAVPFTSLVHAEEQNLYSSTSPAVEGPDHWFWDFISNTSNNKNFTINLPGVDTGYAGNCTIRVSVHGAAYDDSISPDHHTVFRMNGNLIADVTWDDNVPYYLEVTVPQSYLLEGDNALSIEVVMDTGVANDSIYLDYAEVEYARVWEASGGTLNLTVTGPGQAAVSEFPSGVIYLLDVSDPAVPKLVSGTAITNPGTWTLSFGAGTGESDFFAAADTALLSPLSMVEDIPTALRQSTEQVDMLIVAYPAFTDEIAPLALRRESQGLSVKTVSVTDVYDEFSDGEPEPEAIRDLVEYAFEFWGAPAPKYLLLVGDGTFDPFDRMGFGGFNFIPTYLTYTGYLGETASDLYFATVTGSDDLPDLMVGRIPARSSFDVSSYVNKLLAYEDQADGGDWEGRIILAADDAENDTETVFEIYSDIIGLYPQGDIERKKVYLADYPSAGDAQADLLTEFNLGAALVTYVGHSGSFNWTSEGMFTTTESETLTNGSALPVVASFVCLDGWFISPASIKSLAESFVLNPNGGAIVSWSPSSITQAFDKKVLGDVFSSEIYINNARTPAEAAMAALQAGWAQGIADLEDVLRTYIMFGDPSVKIRIATPVTPSAPSAVEGTESVKLNWEANPEKTVNIYHVFRAINEKGPFDPVYEGAETEYSDTGLTGNLEYYYYIIAETEFGYTSRKSSIISATPVPAAVVEEEGLFTGCSNSFGSGKPDVPFLIMVGMALLMLVRRIRRK